MKISTILTVEDPIGSLTRAFTPELSHMQGKRSSVSMTYANSQLVFTIIASDATAMRATLNGITKLITVYEKANTI